MALLLSCLYPCSLLLLSKRHPLSNNLWLIFYDKKRAAQQRTQQQDRTFSANATEMLETRTADAMRRRRVEIIHSPATQDQTAQSKIDG